MSRIIVDPSECAGCGLCASVCIRDGIRVVDGTASENPGGDCFSCGHCTAVCPHAAVSLTDLGVGDPLPEVPGRDAVLDLLVSRRSCRWFTGEPVDDSDLDALFRAASKAPSAMNAMDVEFVVVDRDLEGFESLLAGILAPLADEYPRIASFIRFTEDRHGLDPFLWEGRQVILAFSGDVQNACASMSRIELMAHSMGLGGFYSTWISRADIQDHDRLMSFFPEVDPGKRLGSVYVIGHPRVRFRRTVPRPMPRVHKR